MQFSLNRPALQTAGQILNQQCHAAATAQRDRENGAPAPTPFTDDLVLLAITELTRATSAHRAPMAVGGLHKRTLFDTSLARAVAHIFDLAASHGLDLGSVLAEQLADESVTA
jgi:hypothetical protein